MLLHQIDGKLQGATINIVDTVVLLGGDDELGRGDDFTLVGPQAQQRLIEDGAMSLRADDGLQTQEQAILGYGLGKVILVHRRTPLRPEIRKPEN